MYTIYDYLKYYKDYELKNLGWNIMDNLLCSILVYLPIEDYVGKFLNEIIDNLDKIYKKTSIKYYAMEALKIIKNSERYKNLKITNSKNILNDETQFFSLTFEIDDIKVISYRGTDGTVIGWLENFRLSYIYPTNTHKLAIEYLNNNIDEDDKNVYVVGHSKGGNLAMVSAMESNKFDNIKQIINFDGPGFRKKEYESNKYKKMSEKLINIIPSGSYIGVLLFNDNFNVVTSSKHAIYEHFPNNWNVFGNFFVEGKLSKMSSELHKRSSINMERLDQDKLKNAFEETFKIFDNKTSKINMNFNDLYGLFKNVNKIDKETGRYIYTILNTIINITDEVENEKEDRNN